MEESVAELMPPEGEARDFISRRDNIWVPRASAPACCVRRRKSLHVRDEPLAPGPPPKSGQQKQVFWPKSKSDRVANVDMDALSTLVASVAPWHSAAELIAMPISAGAEDFVPGVPPSNGHQGFLGRRASPVPWRLDPQRLLQQLSLGDFSYRWIGTFLRPQSGSQAFQSRFKT